MPKTRNFFSWLKILNRNFYSASSALSFLRISLPSNIKALVLGFWKLGILFRALGVVEPIYPGERMVYGPWDLALFQSEPSVIPTSN